MDDPKTLVENPDDKTLAEGGLGVFCLNESNNGSVLEVLENGGKIKNNIEVGNAGGKFDGVGEVLVDGEAKMCDDGGDRVGFFGVESRSFDSESDGGETEMHVGCENVLLDGKTMTEGEQKSVENGGGFSESRVGLAGNTIGGTGVEKAECVNEDIPKIENNNDDGSSLITEERCSNGLKQDKLDETNCYKLSPSKESLALPNVEKHDTFVLKADDCGGQEEKQEMVNNQNCSFSVGDVVWVKSKNQSWWPGQVYEFVDSSKNAGNGQEKDCLLIRYFGNGNFGWCSPLRLKHFRENFEEMLKQSKSSNFLGAVDKSVEMAVEEIIRLQKLDMTCSCISKEVQAKLVGHFGLHKGVLPQSKKGSCLAFQFEPSKFIGQVKDLACVISMPGMLEIADVQSHLSAFYCSIGHYLMSLRELREVDNPSGDEDMPEDIIKDFIEDRTVLLKRKGEDAIGNDSDGVEGLDSKLAFASKIENGNSETEEKIEKGFESRERKKSKYLSPPYVDIKASKFSREGMGVSESLELQALLKCSGKKSSKKWSRRSITPSDLEGINACSAALLSDIRLAALDCLHPKENTNFDSTEKLFSIFRSSVYYDWTNSDYSKEMFDQHKKQTKGGTTPEFQPTSKMTGIPDLNENDVAPILSVENSSMIIHVPEGKSQPKKRKIKEAAASEHFNTKICRRGRDAKPISLVVDLRMDANPLANSTEPTNRKCEEKITSVSPGTEMGVDSSNGMTSKKRRRRAILESPKSNASGIPDLNGSGAEPSLLGKDWKDSLHEVKIEQKTRSKGEGTSKHCKPCIPQAFHPAPPGLKPPHGTTIAESPPLSVMKQSLEMMTSTLEKSCDNLPTEMRSKLESDIKALLEKVIAMTTSS